MADIVVVEALRSNLQALIAEMEHLLVRSAYSTNMREARDCSYMIVDRHGRIVVVNDRGGAAGIYRVLIGAILDKYGAGGLHEGDVILSNHPYIGGLAHTPDLAVVIPVFVDGELVGFSCSIAHKPDFGGMVVGSASSKATELYQEGFLLPLVKLYDAGRHCEEIEEIILTNVRFPDLVLGDMRAQIGTNRVGAERMAQVLRRYGVAESYAAFDQMLAVTERRLREALRTWDDGTATVEGFLDNDGIDLETPVRFAVTVEVKGDEITFDFSASGDQTRGPVNIRPSQSEGSVMYAVMAVADPELELNDGALQVVKFRFRSGSVLDPQMPAAVGAATVVRHRLTDVLVEAMGRLRPQFLMGQSGGSGGAMAIAWAGDGGSNDGKRQLLQYEIFGSAMGGRAGADGVNGVTAHNVSLAVTPIEILETQYPLLVRRFELIPDSGGAGEYRGGLSYRREYEVHRPVLINRRSDRNRFPGSGVAGGRPGRLGRMVLNPDSEAERQVPGIGQYELEAGMALRVEGAGAGGYGDPFKRPAASVLEDVRRGYVSIGAARDDYGVVIDKDSLNVDEAATQKLRGSRSG
jgi:N-methylhydantoinase B